MDQPALSPQAQKTPILKIVKPPQDPVAASPSPTPERKPKPKSKISSLETVLESDSRAHHIPSPDDISKPVARAVTTTSHGEYFHDTLHERSSRNSTVEAVRREALVYAQVQTNVTIEDEQHFLTTLSHQLAARYNRYPSSTVVSLLHSQCLFFGGSSHPAYILTITALPSEIQPATNKRNAAVLQKHMEAILGVPPSRGMVRFIPVIEECLAWGSKTVAGRISDAIARDREAATEGEGSKAHERRILKHGQGFAATSVARIEPTDMIGVEECVRVVKKKKSIIHTLFRTSRAGDEDPSGS
ncbi:hypothetical protein ACHAQJ_009420 [Trichoderma viride]